MRLAALVNLALEACALASVGHSLPKARDGVIIGPRRPGMPYFARPVCRRDRLGASGAYYTVFASGVENIPHMCSTLWTFIGSIPPCRMLKTDCGGADGYMEWRFHVGSSCNLGLVHSAWRSATKKELGVLDCRGTQPKTQPDTTVKADQKNDTIKLDQKRPKVPRRGLTLG
ncbi:hypothetical protein LX36DRAFT_691466 [Colletotrichum falcatum]|nr:hypothetical protein LX36DRAFT_691466 [Colletotrichum falcatum]